MTNSPQHDPLLVKLATEAMARQSQGDKSGALIVYKRIQRQFPKFPDAWINASVILFEAKRYEEALDMALRAISLGPENPDALCALANANQHLGNINEAVDCFQRTLRYNPNHVPALSNLAGIYARTGKFAEALELENRAIQIQPDNAVLFGNRGHTKMRALDMAGAEADLKQALRLDANNNQARWNLAYVQLLQRRYQEAWSNFRARLHLDEWSGNKQNFGKPNWKGEALNGRTLLIHIEQGFGDALQFVRFVPQLKRYGGRVMLMAYQPLKRLLSNLPGVEKLIIEGEPLPDFDLVVPLMELPVILNAGLSDLAPLPPPTLPDCKPLPEFARPGFKVGFVWAGNPTHTNDALRSMSPRFLDELADMSGIAWYGLQTPPCAEPPSLPGFIDLSPHMNDFMDTAQMTRQLDLIVTVDTSMAHLVGFLRLSAIILLAYMPDWRWGLDDERTPWYPALTLLRQPAHGDWRTVIGMLRERITELAARI
ncbi:MAG: tetratricopeptide repeat protein [Holophagales bacterium]|jgi:tetratricopeptide (TPR) repeat protein|nr:tetratricopeptide repeat protein [Holophagales bacterium]